MLWPDVPTLRVEKNSQDVQDADQSVEAVPDAGLPEPDEWRGV
jgi:hypothetical protein